MSRPAPPPFANAWPRHLLGLDGMAAEAIHDVLDRAEACLPAACGESSGDARLAGRLVANVFFEDSTRTRLSFTAAARRLGADVLEFTGAGSSLSKGETLADTAANIRAMGVDAMIIRAAPAGAAQHIAGALDRSATRLSERSTQKPHAVPVINAGDGAHEHPTQALLDISTMRAHLGRDLAGRTVAIVGDVASSRVARSNMFALTALGANVRLIGPPTLAPATLAQIASGPGCVTVAHTLDDALPHLDAIMMLRVQFERGTGIPRDYRQRFALTERRAAELPDHAVILHPGPMNRGLEIDGSVADDDPRSAILEQVTRGVAVRMAVLAEVIQ